MDPHPIPTTQWRRTVRRTHTHTHTCRANHQHPRTRPRNRSRPNARESWRRGEENKASSTLGIRGTLSRAADAGEGRRGRGCALESHLAGSFTGIVARHPSFLQPTRLLHLQQPPRLLLPMQHVPSPTLDWRRAAPVVLRPAVFYLSRSIRTTFERSVTRARRPFLSTTFRETWLVMRMGLGLSYTRFVG